LPEGHRERLAVISIVHFPNQPGMNLERVEERCLSHLRQARNPLVSVTDLVAHIRRDEQCVNLEARILVDFLKDHEQVSLVTLPTELAITGDGAGAASGGAEVHVILKERVPTQQELAQLMDQQMESLLKALREALEALGKDEGDDVRREQVQEAISRTEALQLKMRSLL